SFVEMQGHAPMATAGDQRVHQGTLLIRLQQRGGQPSGSVTVENLSDLAPVTLPEEMTLRRAGPVIDDDELGGVLSQEFGVPKMSGGNIHDPQRLFDGKVLWRTGHPIAKGAPQLFRFLPVQPLEDHPDPDVVAGIKAYLFAPVTIEQAIA